MFLKQIKLFQFINSKMMGGKKILLRNGNHGGVELKAGSSDGELGFEGGEIKISSWKSLEYFRFDLVGGTKSSNLRPLSVFKQTQSPPSTNL